VLGAADGAATDLRRRLRNLVDAVLQALLGGGELGALAREQRLVERDEL
jgi:hypothetical protein